MKSGYSLPELVVTLGLMGILCAIALPRLGQRLDRVAVQQATEEVILITSLTRERAVSTATRVRLSLSADTIVVDTLGPGGWGRLRSWLGPAERGVHLTASQDRIVFNHNGIAIGLSNSQIVLSRGFQSETTRVSRLGRIRR